MKRGVELMQAIKTVGAPMSSPDGCYVLYTVVTTDMEAKSKKACDYVYETETKQSRPLTGKRAKLFWEDGHTLICRRGIEGEQGTCLIRLNVETGEESELLRVAEKVDDCWPLEEGRYLLRGTKDFNAPENRQTESWIVHTEYPYKSNGNGFVSGIRHTLFLYDHGEVYQLTDEKTQASVPVIAPDKTKVWFWGQRYEQCSYPDEAIYELDLTTRTVREIVQRQSCLYGHGIYFDGRLYIVKTPICEGDDFESHELWSLLPDGTDFRKELDLSCGNTRMKMTNFDGYFYFTDPECGKRPLKRWKPGSEPEYVINGAIGVESFCVTPKGIFFSGRTDTCPGELYWRTGDGEIRSITSENTDVFAAYGLNAAEGYTFQDMDGFTIGGWCIKPANYEPGKKYPGILFIHGGPSGFFDGYFTAKMQAHAAQGYFVFYCNPRGSGTYGKKHMYLTGQFGTYDFQDLMMFTDETLRRYPDIDPDRLCVTGGSYGGFMTNWIITHTDRFKAAVSIVSTSSWISKLLCCDDSHGKVIILGATPWEDPEKLWWHSPLRYVKNVKTPTLFIQNEHDYRSPPCEAEMMFTSLCRLGVSAKMIMNYKASHGVMNVAQNRNQMEQTMDWFDLYTGKVDVQ